MSPADTVIRKKIAIGYSYLNGVKEHERALDPWYKRPEIDYIVAIEGKYQTPQSPEMMANPMPDYSTDYSEHLLKTTFGDKLVHEKFLGSQMEKRQRYLDIAGELGCDFLITWDSDEYIHPDHHDFDKFFKQLEQTKHWDDQVFNMLCYIPDTKLWPRQHNAVPSEFWMKYARVHKNPGNQRYVLNHYSFTTKDIDDETIFDWDFKHPIDPGLVPLNNPYVMQANIVLDGVRFSTDRVNRSPQMLSFGDGWAWQNMHEENWRHLILPMAKKAGLRVPYENEEYYFNEQGQRIAYTKKGKQALTPIIIRDGQVIKNPDAN